MKKIVLFLVLFTALQTFSQNVGIGTNNPLSKFHVAGTIRSDTLIGAGVRNLFAAPNGRIYDSLVVPSTLNWEVTGNSNITPVRFLGTTNASDVIFKTNSIERARILSTGNIGIGTITPSEALEIGGFGQFSLAAPAGSRDPGDILFKNGNGTAKARIYSNPSFDKGLFFNGDGSPGVHMALDSTGRLGVGTTFPNNRVEITSATANTSGLRFTNLTAASPTVASNGKSLSVDVNGDVVLMPSAASAWLLNGNAGTTAGTDFLGTTDAQDLVIKTNNTEKVRVLTTGQVGIGTNAPSPSAIVQIVSTTQGVMFPSMTSPQRLAIAAPANGLLVYDVTANILMSYNGTRWQEVGGDPIGSIEAFHKSMPATPVLPWGWVECNGQVLADAESPYNGQTIPLLNAAGKFLRGSATSGVMQTEDVGIHTHTGTTAAAGTHNHGGSTGSVNSTNGRVVPWDDNFGTDKMDGANTGQLINTPAGGGGIPWDGLATVGNFLTTIDQLDHTHAISADGNHTHTFTTNASTGTETRPTNMSVVWIMRVK